MSPSQDEARAARIQKYKEDRRKQLTAKTATLFSANVTDRRARRECPPSDETAVHLKSSSELNLPTASTSVPIRTTRTSRLRAAAANVSDSAPTTRNSNRSSSAQSLLDDNKTKPSKIIERDKKNKRQSNDAKLATFDGAKTKSKHSIILEKDKSNFMTSPKGNEKPSSKNSNDGKSKDIHIHVNGVELFDEIVGDHDHSIEKERIDDLFNDLVAGQSGVELKTEETGLNNHSFIQNVVHNVKVDSVVPKVDDVKGLLGAVCVRKVERFSELLSNLCSPCEADVLFEDILVENGINGLSESRTTPECTPPCRRSLPSPRLSTSSTPKRSPAVVAAVNDAAETSSKEKSLFSKKD